MSFSIFGEEGQGPCWETLPACWSIMLIMLACKQIQVGDLLVVQANDYKFLELRCF